MNSIQYTCVMKVKDDFIDTCKWLRVDYNNIMRLYNFSLMRALPEEGKPKDVKSDLRRDADAHWNLILPQIICIIVVLKVLKLPRKCSLEDLYPTQIIFYLLRAAVMRYNLPAWQISSLNETREGHESKFLHIKNIS